MSLNTGAGSISILGSSRGLSSSRFTRVTGWYFAPSRKWIVLWASIAATRNSENSFTPFSISQSSRFVRWIC